MVATGLGEDDFWASTPRQTYRAIKAADRRYEIEEQNRRWHTWHIAALPNSGKFPTLEDFRLPQRADPRPTRRQTIEDQIAIARKWSAAVPDHLPHPAASSSGKGS